MALLGGPWVISRVISRVTILIIHISGLIAPLITTLNPKPEIPIEPFKGTLKETIIATHERPSVDAAMAGPLLSALEALCSRL